LQQGATQAAASGVCSAKKKRKNIARGLLRIFQPTSYLLETTKAIRISSPLPTYIPTFMVETLTARWQR